MTKTYIFSDGKKAVFEYDENGVGKITLECMDELMSMIADRPQGEWIDIEPRLNRRRVNKYKRCSYCGFSWARPFDDNYCPNCGARMLKGADDA